MTRVKKTVEDMEAVKSGDIKLKSKKPVPPDTQISDVDLHCGVARNGADHSALPVREIERLPFPTESLPAPFAAMVKETARVVGILESLAGMTVLGIISASLGSGITARIFAGKITSPNLYLLVGAESGVGKTETAKSCTTPIYQMEEARREPWEREILSELRAEQGLLNREIQFLTRGMKSLLAEKDRSDLLANLKIKQQRLDAVMDQLEGGGPTLIVEDITSQMLAVLLQDNNETLACISSDAGDVVNNILGRNHKLDRVDDSLLVKAFSRDRGKVNRIGRASVQLQHPCLTMVLMVQPDKISTLFGTQQLIDGGLLPRFLVAMTDARPAHMAENKPEFSTSVMKNYNLAIEDLLKEFRLADESRSVEIAPEARRALINFHNVVVDRRAEEYAGISFFAARYAEQAGKIALVLHGAKHGRAAASHAIDLDTAHSAIALTEYFIREQLAILRSTRTVSWLSQTERIVAFAVSNAGSLKVRDLQRKRIVATAQAGEELMAKLVAAGQFTPNASTVNGRTCISYILT